MMIEIPAKILLHLQRIEKGAASSTAPLDSSCCASRKMQNDRNHRKDQQYVNKKSSHVKNHKSGDPG
jgi:hypothetical protein